MKEQVIWSWKILKQYLSNCGIHSARYLVDDNLSYIERVFWLISCTLCWWGCTNTVANVIENYLHDPVVITSADTTYLDWETPLPSISFCIKSTLRIRNKYFRQQPGTLEASPTTKNKEVSTKELLDAYEEMKIPCNILLRSCCWNDVEFDCCGEFQPLLKTGVGYCLTMNSLHTDRGKAQHLHFFVNRTVKHSDLVIDVVMNNTTKPLVPQLLMVYVLNNYQVPIILSSEESQKAKVKKGLTTRVDFTMTNMYNEDPVKNIAVQQRNCRFANEVDDVEMHHMYSTESCTVELYVRRMLKVCGCVNFYYPTLPGVRICNLTESKCILENKREIKSKRIQRSICFPNCEGTDIIIHYNEPSFGQDQLPNDTGRLHFKMLTRPVIRYRRYVVFDLLDLVVSIGSAFSLFMGASVLSLLEIIYWLFVRRDRIL